MIFALAAALAAAAAAPPAPCPVVSTPDALVCRALEAQKGEVLDMPVAHAEGRFVTRDTGVRDRMLEAGQFAVRYVGPDGGEAAYPWNPSGTPHGVAGVCDPTGRVFGLMPHPERACEPILGSADGLVLFESVVHALSSAGAVGTATR